MKVILAGYNVDTQVIEEAAAAGVPRDRMTPEVLSAAYARISRNPAPVNELRQMALSEVAKARTSNKKIIFGMGHHSVAEHAVFNFDIIGLSRLAIEELEHFRLCSFTEKSQRYITLDGEMAFVPELEQTPYFTDLQKLAKTQSQVYHSLLQALYKQLEKEHPNLIKKRSSRTMVEGWAKEDARYATLLCTAGQLGFTANARNLELIIKRLSASKLTECRNLAKAFYDEGIKVAPSILLFTTPSPYDMNTDPQLAEIGQKLLPTLKTAPKTEVSLLDATPNGDLVVAAMLLCEVTEHSFESALTRCQGLSQTELTQIFKAALTNMEFFDAPPRAFEHVHLTYELTISAAAFGQLKRHRMMSQSVMPYNPMLGITVPPAVTRAGLDGQLADFAQQGATLWEQIGQTHPHLAPYALTNAHRRKVLVTTNLRDLYHFCRLREDAHAQWDIREIASKMRILAEARLPLGTLLLCGKDRYVERHKKVFGAPPKIDPAAPAGKSETA